MFNFRPSLSGSGGANHFHNNSQDLLFGGSSGMDSQTSSSMDPSREPPSRIHALPNYAAMLQDDDDDDDTTEDLFNAIPSSSSGSVSPFPTHNMSEMKPSSSTRFTHNSFKPSFISPPTTTMQQAYNKPSITNTNNTANRSLFVSSKDQLAQCIEYLNNKLNNTMCLLPLMSYYSDMNAIHSFKIDFTHPDNDIFITNVIYYLLKEREEELLNKATLQDRIKRMQCDQNAISSNGSKLESKLTELRKNLTLEQQKHLTLQKDSRLKIKKLETSKTALETQNKNLQQKCDQYEHNLVKLEKEMDKLKQQMNHKLNMLLNMNLYGNTLNTSKVDVINQNPAISNSIISSPHQHNRSFSASWKHGLERNEDILYQNVVEAFRDEKQELVAENQQLKRSLKQLNSELNNLRSQYSLTAPLYDSLKDGQFELPYHIAQDEIETAIRDKIQDLSEIIGRGGAQRIYHHADDATMDDDLDVVEQLDYSDVDQVKSTIENLQQKVNHLKRTVREQVDRPSSSSSSQQQQYMRGGSSTFGTFSMTGSEDGRANIDHLLLETNEIPLDGTDLAISTHTITSFQPKVINSSHLF